MHKAKSLSLATNGTMDWDFIFWYKWLQPDHHYLESWMIFGAKARGHFSLSQAGRFSSNCLILDKHRKSFLGFGRWIYFNFWFSSVSLPNECFNTWLKLQVISKSFCDIYLIYQVFWQLIPQRVAPTPSEMYLLQLPPCKSIRNWKHKSELVIIRKLGNRKMVFYANIPWLQEMQINH